MSELNNPMAILNLLEQSNCRECGEPTCMAFAAAVFRGQRSLEECPRLDQETLERFGGQTASKRSTEEDMDETVRELQAKIPQTDLAEAATRVHGHYAEETLTVSVLGKEFHIHANGHLSSEIHLTPWVSIPVLTYVLNSAGKPLTGRWIPFREFTEGRVWAGLFEQRCEKPLKQVADSYPDLFRDMLEIFSGRRTEQHFESDVSIVLWPLPLVPLLVCYWLPEEGMDSSLHLFFDASAEDNLGIQGVYALATGLVRMFEQLAARHSGGQAVGA
jgi:hypothetical protein